MDMKAYKCMIAVLCALVLMPGVWAQKNLDVVRLKCSSDGHIDKTFVTHRNKQTGETNFTTLQLAIKNNKGLVDEFLEAFAKDTPQAYTVAQDQKQGRTLPKFLRFDDGKRSVWYSFSMTDPANATVIYTVGDVSNVAADKSAPATQERTYNIPKGATITINGVKMNAEQAREKGLDIRELPAK